MNRLPKIQSWTDFREVGFYDFLAVQNCIFKAMSKNVKFTIDLPRDLPTRHSLVGLFHHKVMELVFRSESKSQLESDIETEITKLQVVVDSWPHMKRSGAVSGWDEINISAVMAMSTFDDLSISERQTQIKVEEKLSSAEGVLVGRPDFFLVLGNTALLKELKTTNIRDLGGQIRDEYEKQIRFYAVLLVDNFSLESVSAIIESSRGESYRTELNRTEIESMRSLVLKTITAANNKVSGASSIEQRNPCLIRGLT